MAKGMPLSEARAVCERWFAYNQRAMEKAIAMQKIATAVRSGEIDQAEAMRRKRSLDNCSVTVYDGADLEKAVRTLLKHVKD